MLSHLSLFSGIGGIDLAAEWAGFTTVGQVEMADYPTRILEKHWPNVPRWRDAREVTAESFYARIGLRTVDLVSGGFPCQPFSVAGERRGKEDDRYLWPEMFRVITELRPTWVLGENVAGFVSLGLEQTIFDLESKNYIVRAFIVPAAAVGAWHRRDRVFVVAHSYSERLPKWNESEGTHAKERGVEKGCESERVHAAGGREQWAVEPGVDRVANGIPHRVDRLKGLGNAVVPEQVYPFLWAIANSLREVKKYKGVSE